MVNTIIGKNIYELRLNSGFKVKELCKILEIPVSSYYKYEEGVREIPNDIILKIADHYDVTTDYLFGRKDI